MPTIKLTRSQTRVLYAALQWLDAADDHCELFFKKGGPQTRLLFDRIMSKVAGAGQVAKAKDDGQAP